MSRPHPATFTALEQKLWLSNTRPAGQTRPTTGFNPGHLKCLWCSVKLYLCILYLFIYIFSKVMNFRKRISHVHDVSCMRDYSISQSNFKKKTFFLSFFMSSVAAAVLFFKSKSDRTFIIYNVAVRTIHDWGERQKYCQERVKWCYKFSGQVRTRCKDILQTKPNSSTEQQ